MSSPTVKRLPSVDRTAFVIGILAWSSQYLTGWVALSELVVVLAVFLPSVLRESRLLGESDEWTRDVAHRAAYHTIVAALLVFTLETVTYLWARGHFPEVTETTPGIHVFGRETWLKVVVGTYLSSHLLQYWGARSGAARFLLGVAIVNLGPALAGIGFASEGAAWRSSHLWTTLVLFMFFVGAACLVHKKPRLGGWGLLALGVILALGMVWTMGRGTGYSSPYALSAMISGVLQTLIVCGICGLALVRDSNSQSDELRRINHR